MARSTPRNRDRKPLPQPPERLYVSGTGPFNSVYPLGHVSTTRGRDARPINRTTEARLYKSANGVMTNQLGEKAYIWIDEMEADFAVGGSAAQSHKVRQFFPHNFVQPNITVNCTFPTQHFYNTFGAFVRSSHIYALSGFELQNAGVRVRQRRGARGRRYALTTVKFWVKGGNKSFKGSKTSKGHHSPWLLEGYIQSVQAGATKFEYAPTLSFDFTVAESKDTKKIGIWNDEAVRGSEIRPWLDIFKSRPHNDFVDGKTPRTTPKKSFDRDRTRNPDPLPTGFWDGISDAFDEVGDTIGDAFEGF